LPISSRLEPQDARRARSRAAVSAGSSNAARMAMMATKTNNSMSVIACGGFSE